MHYTILGIYQLCEANINVTSKFELDLYLTETPLEPKCFLKLDVFCYRNDGQEHYPNICRLTCEGLTIPITIVAKESAFSIGGHEINKYRSNHLPNKVQAVILTQSWLHGFENIGNLIYINFQYFLDTILLNYIIC